ncbi:unnamed protein product, partial [Durusdinium trenchii]
HSEDESKMPKKAKRVQMFAQSDCLTPNEGDILFEKKAKRQKKTEGDNIATNVETTASTHGHRLFIGGLPWSVDEATLQKDCEECGKVLEVEICKEKGTGRSRGIGFITMKSKKGMEAALQWDGSEYGGRTLKISAASEKESKEKSGQGKDAKREVFVRGLAPSLTEDILWKDFLECGKIERINMPMEVQRFCMDHLQVSNGSG